jgi:hypothetical protein
MHPYRFAALLIAAIAAFSSAAAQTTEIITRPFEGVRHIQRTETSPRLLSMHLIEIDLAGQGIDFRLTPPISQGSNLTLRQTTRSFMTQQGAQLAINGDFYATQGAYANVLHLAVSDGVRYSPFNGFEPAMNINQNNVATVVTRNHNDPSGYGTVPSVNLWNAVGGNEYIVHNGNNVANWNELHPRTAIGVTADQKLLMFVVDGRQAGHSGGMTTPEVAALMIQYGAIHAINLDGGGSTTLAMADPTPRVVNRPSDGTERAVGNNLAVFANAIAAHQPLHEAPHFVRVLDDFRGATYGRFHRPLTYSSQTQNVSMSSRVALDGTESATGDYSQLLQVRRTSSSAQTWRVRHVSGDANPANNPAIDVSGQTSDGWIGFFARTETAGIRTALALDNNDNSAGTMIGGIQRQLVADGNWHLYEWNLDDPAHWGGIEGIPGTRTSIADGWVTVDSIMLYGGAFDAHVWIDTIAHNPFGSLSSIANWTAGDANLDGKVDIADLGILAANWQQSGRHVIHGDFDGDGQVNIADLGMLAANWQAGPGTMTLDQALALFDTFDGVVVPEPAAATCAAAVLGWILMRRRKTT